MPNNCIDTLLVVGPPADVDAFWAKSQVTRQLTQYHGGRAVQVTSRSFSLGGVVPHPASLRTLMDRSYGIPYPGSSESLEMQALLDAVQEETGCHASEWHRNAWGTNKDAFDVAVQVRCPGVLKLHFWTAWSPPYLWLSKAADAFPSLGFFMMSDEENMGIFVDYYNSACGQLEEVDRSEWRDVYGWLDQEHAARAVAAVVGEGEQEQQQQGEEDEEGGQEAFRMHMRRMDRRHALGPRCLLHHLVRSLSAGDVFEGDAPPPCPAPHPALLRAAGLARPRTSLEGGAACAAAAPAGPEQAAPWRGGAACEWCGEEGEELVRCGRCRDAWYCNKACQVAHWKAGHKQRCRPPRGA